MKKKFLHACLTLFASILIAQSLYAQRTVVLHGADSVQVFQTVDPFVDAYNAAQDGDTIYLSGGSFNPPALIDKRLRIIGAGYNPDTTHATTFPTHIAANITYGNNASHLYIEGIRIQGNFVKHAESGADFITLRRVFIDGVLNFQAGSEDYASRQISVLECIINGAAISNFHYVENSLFSNSIFAGRLLGSVSNNFSNNLFLYTGSCSQSNYEILTCSYNFFNNNIFVSNSCGPVGGTGTSTGNSYINNIFVRPLTTSFYLCTSPMFIDNYLGITRTDIFINQTGGAFNFSHDYNLQDPETYLGQDGTQVGIYGGLFPFKDKGVPSNPHISRKVISSTTNTAGEVSVEIDVHAQNK